MKPSPRTAVRQGGHTIGRAGFPKISAIEGLHLTEGMVRDLDAFEREQLSPAERRRAIGKKYDKARYEPIILRKSPTVSTASNGSFF